MSTACAQEMCPNWGGDGRICPCAVLDLEPRIVPPELDDDEEDDPHDGCADCPYDCPQCSRCDCCNCQIDHEGDDDA